jgi:hypothetical protein
LPRTCRAIRRQILAFYPIISPSIIIELRPEISIGYALAARSNHLKEGEISMKSDAQTFHQWLARGFSWLFALSCLMLLAVSVVSALAQSQGQKQPPKGAPPNGFPDLIAGLKSTPGCLGVETAMTAGGKNVIFAWFEDKKAVLKWYYSETHQAAMRLSFPGAKPDAPLQGVPDDVGPIMAIASITLAEKPMPGTNLPFSQISIELYKPITGGISIGGRFAPDSLQVPNIKDYTPKKD